MTAVGTLAARAAQAALGTSDDKLCFYSKSADKPAPGKGAGERVAHPAAYAALRARHGWRRVLSNFDECEFKFEGRTYRTVEHAFQAAKIRLADPAAAERFSVESGTELGLGDGLAARKQRKMVRLDADLLRAWDATSGQVMERLQWAKFSQCPAAAATLLDTLNAQLWHIVPRSQPVRFVGLERVRAHLRARR